MVSETKLQAFKLKGRLYTFTVIQLQSTDADLFSKDLEAIIAKAPKLFSQSPVVIDLSLIHQETLSLADIQQQLLKHQLYLVGLQGASESLSEKATALHIPLLHASPTQDKTLFESPKKEELEPLEAWKTKVIHNPIRSGQQAVSKGGDLIVIAQVSHGAELLADGHIHVYGVLRGRALAGMSGDKDARIFCQSLDAELISIAGFYRLSDAMEPHPGPCQIYLQDEHICIEPLC